MPEWWEGYSNNSGIPLPGGSGGGGGRSPRRDSRGRFTSGDGDGGGGEGQGLLARALARATDALSQLTQTTDRATKSSEQERREKERGGAGALLGGALLAGGVAAAHIGGAVASGRSGDVAATTFDMAAGVASYVPGLGQLAGQITEPLQRTEQRVGAITGVIAAAGGTVPPELRAALVQRFSGEERRRQRELEAVDAATKTNDVVFQVSQGTALGAVGRTVNDWINNLFAGGHR